MKNNIRSIKEANIAKRLLAMIMDGVIFAFTIGCLVSWLMVPLAEKNFDYSKTQAKAAQHEVFSKLYVLEQRVDDKSKIVEINEFSSIGDDAQIAIIPLYNHSSEDVDFYKERIKYYYLNYKTNKDIQYDTSLTELSVKENYYSPVYNQNIKLENGTEVLPENYYTDEWFNNTFSDEKYSTLDGIKNAAYEAVADLYTSSYFTELNNSIKRTQLFIFLPPLFLSFIGYYIVAPLCFKNGETLAKKVVGIGFVTKDGYDIKKRQIIFRQILLMLYVMLSLFVIGIGLTSIATLGLGVVIYLVATLISKSKRSPIDYAAYTYLIDTHTSVWFKDASEEEKREKEYEEKMSKYTKVDITNKNVIQVGGTIIDPELKKGFEEINK